jgi:hypothetical protein
MTSRMFARIVALPSGLALAGAASAHPGHDHSAIGGFFAALAHAFTDPGVLLVVAVVGAGIAVVLRRSSRD